MPSLKPARKRVQQRVMNWILAFRRMAGVEADTAVRGMSVGSTLSISPSALLRTLFLSSFERGGVAGSFGD